MAALSNTVLTLYSVSNGVILTANTSNTGNTIMSTSNAVIFTTTSINNAIFEANLGKPEQRVVWS